MNKIFKIIWSKARNCYVVVSELAKSHDDGHVRRSRSGCCRKAAVLAAFVLTMSLAVVPVWAADSKGNINNVVTINNNQPDRSAMDGNNNLNGNNNVVYGTGNTADKSGAVIVGKNSKGDQDSVVIGNNAQSNAENQIIIGHGIANSTAKGSIIIGNTNNTVDTSQSVLIGNNTKANGSGKGIVIIGNGAMADSEAAGYTDNGGTYIPAGIVLGEYSYSNTRAGKEGFLSNKKGDKPSPAFTDEYWNAVWKATANPMAIGNADTDANGKGEGHNGHGVLTRQITGVAAGTDLTDAVNVAQLQAAMAQFSGGGSGTGGDGVHYYSVSSKEQGPGSNYDNKGATGANALAAGVSASAIGAHSVAVGNGATAKGQDSIALGTGAVADGIGATAIGQYNTALGQNSLAFGGGYNKSQKGNTASGVASVAFGEGTQAIAEGTLAFGENTQAGSTEKDDNNNPLGQNAVAFGNRTKATGGRSLAFGERTLASANDATAFGNESVASNTGATAFGNKNQATGQYATAWGGGDKTVGGTKIGTVASGTYATAFGERTEASGESATAFGENSTASGEASTAFGIGSTAAAKNSLAALGGTVAETATNAAAIGNGAKATLADSIALGSGSVASRAKFADLTNDAEKKAYGKGTGTAFTGSAWQATANAVAIGNDSTVTRQLTGVAAGSLDTDAVNVAQLKGVDSHHTVVTVGGTSVSKDNDTVTGGNLDLKRTTAANGQETYDLSLDKYVTLGEQAENKGGKLTVNNVDAFKHYDNNGNQLPDTTVKEAVKIDGKTVSVVKHDGPDGENDQRQVVLGIDQDAGGYMALYDNSGKKPTYIYNAISPGITYLQDKDSYLAPNPTDPNKKGTANEFGRLEYGDYHAGTVQFIATLGDGQKYAGDNYQAAQTETTTVEGKTTTTVKKEEQNVILKKLNERLDIQGGAKGELTKDNIGVNAEDGVLKVQLAKNLTDLNSVSSTTINATTVNTTTTNTQNIQLGDADNSTKITYNGTDNRIQYGDTNITNTLATTDDGLNFGGDVNKTGQKPATVKLTKTVTIKGDYESGKTLTTGNIGVESEQDGDNAKLTIKLADQLTGLTSVTTGNTTINTNGLTIENGNNDIVINNNRISMGGNKITNVANGESGTDAVNMSQLNQVKVKYFSVNDTQTDRNVITTTNADNDAAFSPHSMAIGYNALAKATSDSPGYNPTSSHDGATALGNYAEANGERALALGYNSSAIGLDAITIGYSNGPTQGARNTNAIAIGAQTTASGYDSTTVGSYAEATAEGATSFGSQAKSKGTYSTSIGKLANGIGENGTAGDYSTAVGASSSSSGKYSAAFGYGARASGAQSMANGSSSFASDYSLASGSFAKADGTGSTALGYASSATVDYGVALGGWSKADRAASGYSAYLTNEKPTLAAVSVGDTTNKYTRQIINVAGGTNDTDAVNVAQLKAVQEKAANAHTTVSVGGQKAEKNNKEVKGGNLVLTRTQDADTHAYNYDVKLGNDITVGEKGEAGKNGVDGKISVNGKDGSAVVINGKNGSIGLNGKDGANGLTIRGAAGKDGITRIVYKDANGKDHPVATLDDGLKFKGDTGDVITKKLNETLTIKGGQTNTSKLSTGKNVGVINEKGALRIELAKNLDLSDEGSVKTGDTIINNKGLTIKNGPTITKTNISMNNQQIHNVKAGTKGTDAVNVDQLNKVQQLASKHTKVTVEGGTAPKGQTYVGKNLKINVTTNSGQETYDLKLADNLNIGEKGADGKNGVDGKIGVNGKNGSAVVINGKDGSIGLNGKDGANGLTIRGAAGKSGVDGKDGITRIVYKDAAGKDHPVATLDDGLKFKGDTGDVISKKLNDTLTIKGGQIDPSKLSTGKNVGVVNEKGALRIELAKKIDLGEEGSVKTGDTIINNNGLTIKNGPTITKTNVSMNNQQIHNVAAGKKGTDAVNVDQLNEVQTLASQHTKVTVEGGTAPKGTTYVGKNLKINVTDNKGQKTYDLKLADNLSIGEKGADGKDGKIGVNGKNGSSVVINGKDGTIGLKGKDGTNGLTIRGAAGKPGVDGKDGITRIVYNDAAGKNHPVATLDDGLNFKGDDGTVISKKLNQRMDIVGGANKNNLSENNIGVISDNGKLHVKLAKDLKDLTSVTTTDGKGNTTVQNGKGVTVKDSQNNTSTFTAKDITFTNRDKSRKTKLDEDGLTIFTKGASGQANQTIKITNTYISMGGQQIHNVLAGKADTDAVNVSQLKAVQSVAEAHSTVSVGGKKAGKDSVDVKGGNLVLKRTENTNGSKNYDVKLADDISIKSVTTTDDKGNKTVQKGSGITTIDKDGNKTSITGEGVTTVDKDGNKTSLTGKGMTTVDKDGNKTSVTGKGVSISGKDGNKTTITEKGLTIKGGPVVTKDKFSAGGQQIHDVKAGKADTDAVNVSQLKDEIGKVEQHHTEVTVNGGTEAQEGTYNTSGNLQIKKTTEKDTGKKTYDLKLADNLTFGAKDGADGKDGVDGSIGINGKNGSAVVINGKDGSIGLNGADGKNGLTIKGADGTVGVDGKAGTTRLIYETKDGEKTVKHEVATMDDGMKYSGDSGNAAVKLNKNVQIYGGATEYADGNNIGVVASQDGDNAKLQVKLAKDLKGINSIEAKTITTGNTTINNSGLTVKGDDNHKDITIQQGNVNMGGNTISGVADGKVSKDSTDAVNGSQLWQRDQAINGLSGSVNKLGNRINRVGAGAAALAALHPLDFDPDDKWDFAAGYGNYRGANAAAIGAYYRPNEDTMFSVGGSFGGGENMVNAGVSIKLGQGNHVSTSRVAMAKEMKAMRQHMAEQDALIAKLQSMHGMAVDPTKSTLFPDVAENHWAYQYVTTLAKKGILEGYPDGEFKGDRMMTRYEFAAIVYRIVESGVGSTDPELSKLVKEFSPELQYIRIDTIQKDRNGKPTIERVRVISDAK